MKVTVFLCGDVMTGRGVEQILARASDPRLHEPLVEDARTYVSLAEAVSGAIPRSVPPAYIWGDALEELERGQPDVRVVNLETSVTRSGDYWEGKEVHYRMHPENVACLTAARIDIAVMANNHVLDWGMAGLVETIANSHHARPIEMYRNRLILYGCGDLVNDYEGIAGYGEFRDDLAVMYFPTIDTATGELVQLRMVPMQIRKLSLHRPSPADVQWLGDTIAQISAGFGSSIERADGSLVLRWRS